MSSRKEKRGKINQFVYEVWLKNNRYFQFFSKSIYLFNNNCLLLFKVTPLRYDTLLPALFPILETLLKRVFWYPQPIIAKRFPFNGVFSFGKRKKSAGARSFEYDGWGMITVLFLAKNSRTSIDVWANVLSWCKIYDRFFHNSVRFWRIASRNWRITSR